MRKLNCPLIGHAFVDRITHSLAVCSGQLVLSSTPIPPGLLLERGPPSFGECSPSSPWESRMGHSLSSVLSQVVNKGVPEVPGRQSCEFPMWTPGGRFCPCSRCLRLRYWISVSFWWHTSLSPATGRRRMTMSITRELLLVIVWGNIS